MKKLIILIVLVTAILAGAGVLVVYNISPDSPETAQELKQKKPPVVEVVPAFYTTVSRLLELTGSVKPYKEAHLASPAEGPIEKLNAREGDAVRGGEPLLFIGRKKGAEALIASLRQELQKEQANLSRKRNLVEKGAIAEEELDRAKAGLENVRARLAQAEESLRDYVITAPWHGIVSGVHVKEGQFVSPRTVVIEIYDPDSLVITAAVPERHAAEISPDMGVEVELDAYPEKQVRGSIDRIYPYLDSRLRTRTIEIVPDEPLDLLPGMFARLKIVLEKADDAVAVPKEAVVSTPAGPAVFVVEDGKTERRIVETGIEEKEKIQIVRGVVAGEKVAVAGNQKLKHGMSVRIAEREKSGVSETGTAFEQSGKQQPAAGDVQQ